MRSPSCSVPPVPRRPEAGTLSQTVHLLANPSARLGGAAARIEDVDAALQHRGREVVHLSADDAEGARAAAASLVQEGADRLIVIGGDGMVHLAVQALATSDITMGVLPFGTGNDFAGALGLPTDLDQAIDRALAPATPVDLMRIGDQWAASVATLGFSVDVNARANMMRWPSGSSRYTLATLRELPSLRTRTYSVDIDGTMYELPAVLLTVANTSDFGGGMRISPQADPADGLLDLTVVGATGRLELLRWFRKVFDGSHLDHPSVTTLRGRTVTISAPDAALWADGEPVTTTPTQIEAVPGALQLAGVAPT